MVFSSTIFTFFFLPIVIVLYFMAKEKYRNYILLIASLIFYGYGEPKFVYIMLGSIVLNYLIALGIDILQGKCIRKALMIAAVVLNLGLLYCYKYLDFSISLLNKYAGTSLSLYGIVLPIGISFFTFQALSYVIDVYRGDAKAQRNVFNVALYIALFPQLIAGPIVRYNTIASQIEQRTTSIEKMNAGAKRFMRGFGKKVLLSNNLAIIAERVFGSADYAAESTWMLWLGAICFSLQIFYDFSGYSDMAIGLGRIFGFEFEENFDYPYISKTVTEFWRRWHISLGRWFRDYVYIPLGGSRTNTVRCILNLFVVWTLTGIWHGANLTFVLWGLMYFILLVIEKFLVKPEKRESKVLRVLWQIFTLVCVNFGWVIFNSQSVSHGARYCLSMIGYYGLHLEVGAEILGLLREYGFYIIAGLIFSTPVAKMLSNQIAKNRILNMVKEIILPIAYIVMFLWAVSFLVLGVHNPFIYFNF